MSRAEVLLALGSSLLGAIIGPLFQMLLPQRSGSRSINVIHSPGAHVSQEDPRVEVKQDIVNRIALGQLPPAPQVDDRHVHRQRKVRRSNADTNASSSDDTGATIAAFLIVAAIVVGFFFEYQEAIIFALIVVAAFTLTFLLSAVLWARLKRVRFERKLAFQNALAVVLAAVVFAAIYLLDNPLYRGGGEYRDLVALGREGGLPVFIREYGLEGAGFILYQVVGVVAAFLLLAFILLHGAKLLAAANLATGVKPIRLWAWLTRLYGQPGAVLAISSLLALISGSSESRV